jgi:hypothetical protein
MDAAGKHVVSVFGANSPRRGDGAYETARAVGRVLAELGYRVANGGYGGTMEASARGAREAGGETIGVTCSLWGSSPNRYIDQVILTASLAERVAKLIDLGGSGYVVMPGATGTLVELATAWEMLHKRLLPERPLVCVGRFWEPLVVLITHSYPSCASWIDTVDDPEELRAHFPARQPA